MIHGFQAKAERLALFNYSDFKYLTLDRQIICNLMYRYKVFMRANAYLWFGTAHFHKILVDSPEQQAIK